MRSLLNTLCGTLAAVALFAIMLLTFVDVGGRKFLDTSLPGALELTEMLMVVVIFAGLPLVSLRGEHVTFDSLDPFIPRAVRLVQHLVVDLLCAAMLLFIAWLMWTKAGQLVEYGDVSARLKIPVAPFVYAMSVLCAVTAAVHLLLIVRPVAHRHVGVEESA
ncbi:MAG: TRAP transporter small permease [Burkholderiaceae bacterium]|nr:TRAP transporter small permease [Burkholderiaceae bacterium]MCU0927685.1 TRAP transporter small permease [Burkholderiaceae bacterium]